MVTMRFYSTVDTKKNIVQKFFWFFVTIVRLQLLPLSFALPLSWPWPKKSEREIQYNISRENQPFLPSFFIVIFSWSVQLIRNILSAPISPILIMIKRFRNDIARRKNTRQKKISRCQDGKAKISCNSMVYKKTSESR